jgi:predicted PurR-regulated permease PerM
MIYWLSGALLPFIIGVVLAYLMAPMTKYLERITNNHTFSAILSVSIACGIIFASFALIVPVFVSQLYVLYRNMVAIDPKMVQNWLSAFNFFHELPLYSQKILNDIFNSIPQQAARFLALFLESLVSYTGKAALELLLIIIISPFTAFYLLRDRKNIENALLKLVPSKYTGVIFSIVKAIDFVFTNFIRGQLLVAFILTIYHIILFLALGFEAPIGLGIIVGLCALVPYVGTIISFVFILLLSFAQFSSHWTILFVLIGLSIAQICDMLFLRPKFVGQKLGLHPILAIMSIIISASVFGIIGMFLAIPLTVLIVTFIRFLLDQYQLCFVKSR